MPPFRPPPISRPRGGLRETVSVLLVAAVVAVYFAHVHRFWAQINDDAYITFRYSLNLARGVGPYFNPNEHVEGYTNFLQMVGLAAIARLAGPEVLPSAAKLLGVLAGAGCVAVASLLGWTLLRERHPGLAPGAAITAGALVAVSPSFAVNATTGLETLSYALFLGLGCTFHLRNPEARWVPAAIAFAAAALSRPEGLMIFGVHWLTRPGAAGDRKWLHAAAVVGGVVILHGVFRWAAYDGEWLPNTYFAKRGGFWGPTWPYVRDGFLTPLGSGLGVALAVAGWWLGRRAMGRRVASLAVPAAVGALSPFLTGTDWMVGHRLLVPYLPLAAPLVASGWILLVRRAVPPLPTRTPAAILLVPVVLWLAQDPARRTLESYVHQRAGGYRQGHFQAAAWCRDQLQPTDIVALMDIGIIGYRCLENPVIDLTGLTDRYIAKSEGDFLKKDYDPSYIFEKKPEVIVLVLGVDRSPRGAPDPRARIYFVNRIERRIAEAPEFQRWYRRPTPPELPADWRRALTLRAGAEVIFEHDHPGMHYLLAMFRRREPGRTG